MELAPIRAKCKRMSPLRGVCGLKSEAIISTHLLLGSVGSFILLVHRRNLRSTEPSMSALGLVCARQGRSADCVFSDVKVETPAPVDKTKPVLFSTLETVPVMSGDRRVAYVAQARFEAPSWARDGSYFLFNQEGGIYRLDVNGEEPTRMDTGAQTKCNNDHGFSPWPASVQTSVKHDSGRE
jgi:hypothetical protein